MLVSGPGTTAVFQDDLAFGASADLNLVDGGKVVVLNQHSFTLAGNLSIELSYTHPSLITVGGDVGIGQGTTDLTLNLASDALHSLKHGDAFQIISFARRHRERGLTDPTQPDSRLCGVRRCSPTSTCRRMSLHSMVWCPGSVSNQGVYAVFLDPTMVGPPGGPGAIAPDFNGDGVVDLADFAIWQAHVGQMSGASVLDGDADGDGDVDGADFLKWQRNVGKPMPWTGSGCRKRQRALASVPSRRA